MDCRNSVFFDKKNVDREYVYSVRLKNMIQEMILKDHFITK
jgi:hypothetical protein